MAAKNDIAKYTAPYKNPLHKPTWFFFDKTSNLDGIIHQTIVWQNKIQLEINSKSFHLIGRAPIISNDLTSDTPLSEEPPVNIIRAISREEYINFINNISNLEVGFVISQSYEYFETFLYDILAAYVKLKYNSYKGKEDEVEIRALLKYQLKKGNNSKALSMLRKESKIYKTFEQTNTSEINMADWYAIFSLVRHSITHTASSIKREDFNKLSKERQVLFNITFPTKADKEFVLIKPTYETFRIVIKRIHSHAHLIFKGLSESLKLDSFPIFVDDLHDKTRQYVADSVKNSKPLQ